MLRILEMKPTSQGKFSAGRSKQCFGSQLCLNFLLLFWNAPKEIFNKQPKFQKNVDFSLWGIINYDFLQLQFFPNFRSLWGNFLNTQKASYLVFYWLFSFQNWLVDIYLFYKKSIFFSSEKSIEGKKSITNC